MAITYEPIATTTLGSAAADITFSSIGAGYTDLRLVVNLISGGFSTGRIQLNSDTGSNYSDTSVYGNGTAAASNRNTSGTAIRITGSVNFSTTLPTLVTVDFFSYAGSTNKTTLITLDGDYNGSGQTSRIVGLWRNTAAITTIKFFIFGNDLAAGTTATLYGILKA